MNKSLTAWVSIFANIILGIILFFSIQIKDSQINLWKLRCDTAEKGVAEKIKPWQDRYEALRGDIQPTIEALKTRINLLEKENTTLNERVITLAKQLDSLKANSSVANNKEASSAVTDIMQSSQKISEQSKKITTEIAKTKEDLKKFEYLTIEGKNLMLNGEKIKINQLQ